MVRERVDKTFWALVCGGLGLIAVFNYAPHLGAVVCAAIWLIILIWSFVGRIQRSLGILLLASCYERPILDFGMGIRGTVKLVDLVILAVLIAAVLLPVFGQSLRAQRSSNGKIWSFAGLVALAIISAYSLKLFQLYSLDEVKLSIYYAAKLTEYFLAFLILTRIRFEEQDVRSSLNVFLAGLVVVAIIGVMQGVGLLETYYYETVTGYARVDTQWAISTLGPNHTHLGTFMALGVMLAMFGLDQKVKLSYLAAMSACLAGLAFSHSATGMGMVGIYFAVLMLMGSRRMRLVALGPLLILMVLMFAYFAGLFEGESHLRTAARLSAFSPDSHFLERSFVRPWILLAEASEQNRWGLLFGFGFRVANQGIAELPSTGDNNYFSVVMDLGILGLSVYLLFLGALLSGLVGVWRAGKTPFSQKLAFHGFLVFITVFIAMFTQEILWPLHSRGSTMLIFLVIIELSSRADILNRSILRQQETDTEIIRPAHQKSSVLTRRSRVGAAN